MKRIIIISVLLVGFVSSYSQTFLPPRSSPTTTVQDSRLRALLNFYYPHTHGLTLNNGLDTLGMVMYEDSSGHVWYRDTVLSGGHKWSMLLKVGDGVSGVSSFNTRTGAVTLSSGDVVTALGFTPINPNGTSFQYIAGDGSKVTFPTIPAQINITDAGLFQHSGTYPNYTFTGLTPTQQQVFTQGSTLTTNNFWVTGANVLGMTGTAAFGLPTGSTSQRPSSPGTGYFRYNTDSSATETYNGSQWVKTGTGTGVTGVTSFNTRTGSVTLTGSDVTTALTFTPYNATNPAAYISNITGLISSGANITITGSGTVGSPYVIVGTGSGSVFNQDSIKHRFVDTGSTARNLYTLAWDSVNKKWILTAPGTGGGGTGTVTNFSFTNANGFTGTVTNSSTIPALTVGTSITGLLFGNGTAISNATVSSPLTYSAGTLGIQVANTSQNGYLSSTDWNTFNGKINLSSLSATSPVLYNNGTGVISEQVANTSQNGYLSSTDWNTFNGKQSALSGTGYLNFTGTTPSYLTPTQVTANLNLFTTTLQGLVPAPSTVTGKVLSDNGTWVSAGGTGTVTSVAATVPGTLLTVGGSPVTGAGTLAFGLATASANLAFGNFTGSTATPTFGKLPLAAMATGTANTLMGYDGSGNPSGITLTTTGTSGPAQIVGGVLNIPNYATGAGSQTLDQTLAFGNTTNKQILSTANIRGDSALYRNALFTGNMSVGDTNYASQLFLYVIDNSIGLGSNASPLTQGYAYKLAYDYGWSSQFNRSISGTTIKQVSAGDSSFENRIPTFATYNSTTLSYFIVGSGINDLVTDTVNVKISLAKILDSIIIVRNWPQLRVINYSPPYSPVRLGDSVFVSAQRTICLAKGVIYVDIYHRMKALYQSGMQLVSSDSLHPTTLGQAYIEQWIAQAIDSVNPGIHMAGNLTVRGIADIKGNDTTRGNSYFAGLVTAPTGVSLNAINTGLRLVAPFISTGGDRGILKWVPNAANSNFTDSFYLAYEGQGAQNAFVLGRLGTTNPGNKIYLSQDDDIIFHGNRSNAQTGFRYIFNGIGGVGGVYVNGPIKSVSGVSQFLGFNAVGDAVTGINRSWHSYTSGFSTNYIQTDPSGFFQIGSGPNDLKLGSWSTSDGTTFTTNLTVFRNGGGVGIGTATLSTPYYFQVSPNMDIFGNRTMANQLGNGGFQLSLLPSKFTDNSSTTSQKNTLTSFVYIGADTLASTNAAVVDTNAASLFIAGPPIAGTNTTIQNPWSLYVNSGKIYIGDSVVHNVVPTGFGTDSILTIGTNHTMHKLGLGSGLSISSGNLVSSGGITTVGAFSGSSQTNGASISTNTITFGPADATNPGMLKATGSQTLGVILTQPAPLFTGLTSSGANDSVLTVDPSTGQVHRRYGTFNLKFANGVTAPTTDSVYWGGSLNQTTTINGVSGNYTVAYTLGAGFLEQYNGTAIFGGQVATAGQKEYDFGSIKSGSFVTNPSISIDTLNNIYLGASGIGVATPFSNPIAEIGNVVFTQNVAENYKVITTNTTLSIGAKYLRIYVDCTAGNVTVTLPSVSAAASGTTSNGLGLVYYIKRVDNSVNTCTIAAVGSDVIDGSATVLLTSLQAKQLQAVLNNNWYVQ